MHFFPTLFNIFAKSESNSKCLIFNTLDIIFQNLKKNFVFQKNTLNFT